MRKKRNTQSRKRLNAVDAAVVLFCLLGAFLSFWFFWQDLNRAINRNQAPVGTITFKKGGAQRRLGDRVLWDRLRRESPVYDGDIIRTSELSDATVTFSSKPQKFSLSENSLIQVRTEGERTVVDLTSGDISVENSGPSALVLVSGGRQVELSGVMKARAGEDGGFELEVLEGTAVVSDGKDRAVREAGQVFAVDGEGRTVDRPRVVMLLPRPGEEFTSREETLGVNFSWVPVKSAGTGRVRLEIAADRRFIQPLESLEAEGSGASADLPPGAYWWRAYASGAGPGDVSPEKFTILPAAAPPAIPAIAAPVPVQTPPEPPAAAEEAPPESPPPAPPPAKPEPARTPPVPPPARPRPAPESPPAAVSRLPAVTDRWPENNYRIGPAQIRQSRSLTFRWKEASGANAYIFTLREASGGNILSTETLAGTSYTLDLRRLDRGNFLWQVEAVRQNRGIVEQRGTVAGNRFTLDIPLPGNPRLRETGPLYGTESP
jgi:hypothetical protein